MNATSPFSLEGKVAIVTGGSTGIGRSIALALAQSGADVAVASRTVEELEATCQEIRSLGRVGFVLPTDVTKYGDLKRMVKRTHQAYLLLC